MQKCDAGGFFIILFWTNSPMTLVEKINRKGNVFSCDAFSTYRDGRPIGTEEYLILETLTWESQRVKL